MICHTKKCHRPRTSSCHKEQRGGAKTHTKCLTASCRPRCFPVSPGISYLQPYPVTTAFRGMPSRDGGFTDNMPCPPGIADNECLKISRGEPAAPGDAAAATRGHWVIDAVMGAYIDRTARTYLTQMQITLQSLMGLPRDCWRPTYPATPKPINLATYIYPSMYPDIPLPIPDNIWKASGLIAPLAALNSCAACKHGVSVAQQWALDNGLLLEAICGLVGQPNCGCLCSTSCGGPTCALAQFN